MESLREIKLFLAWRKKYNVENIYDSLISENMCFESLRTELTIGKNGGCYPFFSQSENGDITDIWVLRKQNDDSEEEIQQDLFSHIKLNEFRSIVIDRLSYVKRRVVMFKVIYDLRVIKDSPDDHMQSNELKPEQAPRLVDWWTALKKWEGFLKELIAMYSRWYGGSLSRCHVFGTGNVFKLFTSRIAKKIFGLAIGNDVNVLANQSDYHKVLEESFGDKRNWPTFLDGGTKDPHNTELSQKKLSSFVRSGCA